MERVVSSVERWAGRIMLFCAIGTCACFAYLAFLQFQVSGQAAAGQKARTRQTAVYGVSLKVYDDAFARGVITSRDLDCFKTGRHCPAPAPSP